MTDTNYFRYTRDGIVGGTDYHSLKNVGLAINYSKRVDIKYTNKWLDPDGVDKYGPNHIYQIQQLRAICNDTFYGDGDDAYLEWVDIDG